MYKIIKSSVSYEAQHRGPVLRVWASPSCMGQPFMCGPAPHVWASSLCVGHPFVCVLALCVWAFHCGAAKKTFEKSIKREKINSLPRNGLVIQVRPFCAR